MKTPLPISYCEQCGESLVSGSADCKWCDWKNPRCYAQPYIVETPRDPVGYWACPKCGPHVNVLLGRGWHEKKKI